LVKGGITLFFARWQKHQICPSHGGRTRCEAQLMHSSGTTSDVGNILITSVLQPHSAAAQTDYQNSLR